MELKMFVDRQRNPNQLTTFGAVVMNVGIFTLIFVASFFIIESSWGWLARIGFSTVIQVLFLGLGMLTLLLEQANIRQAKRWVHSRSDRGICQCEWCK